MSKELNNKVIESFQSDVISMMQEQFEQSVAIVEDPETGDVTLFREDGEDISETEHFALFFFESGWNAALKSFERMGASYALDVIEKIYERKDADNDDTGGIH